VSRKDEILSKMFSVTSIPPVAIEATQLLQDPEANINNLVRVIEYDPGLTSNILRLANSAYYGFPESIGSVKDAIVRLGMNRIFEMVMTWVFSPLAQRRVPGYGLSSDGLWRHSIAVAVGAEQLAADLNRKSPAYTFTAGMLHDIGKIVLGTFLQEEISSITEMAARERVSLEVAEQHVLGIDHAEAGAVLLENWNLPSKVADVSRWHHQPEFLTENTLVTDLVHVADTMCLMGGIGSGIDGCDHFTSADVVERLNLTALTTDSVISHILEKIDEVCSLFGGNGASPDI